jgi:hypothetical protein
MTKEPSVPFTHSHASAADGTLAFRCATSIADWPWLALDPFDPIVVQSLNYYGPYETAVFRGEYAAGQWTALTQTEWRCGEGEIGHAVRGVADAPRPGDDAGYRIRFYDEHDRLAYLMTGKGVVFRNRNFEQWRERSRQDLAPYGDAGNFIYAPAASVGMATQVESLVSDLNGETGLSVTGLVTRNNGFPPAHPYHSGSGDHVNASHLADACRQFVRLARDEPKLLITGGRMQFQRYVELEYPFLLEIAGERETQQGMTISISQAGEPCASVYLGWTSEQ